MSTICTTISCQKLIKLQKDNKTVFIKQLECILSNVQFCSTHFTARLIKSIISILIYLEFWTVVLHNVTSNYVSRNCFSLSQSVIANFVTLYTSMPRYEDYCVVQSAWAELYVRNNWNLSTSFRNLEIVRKQIAPLSTIDYNSWT